MLIDSAVYGRPHSSDCAVDEHRQIIRALRAGDAEATMRIMDEHLGAVEARAQLVDRGPADLKTVLNRYAGRAATCAATGCSILTPCPRTSVINC